MRLAIVPPYAAILAVLFVGLSLRVIRARRIGKVPVGMGTDKELERRARVQANFAEYVPFALLLLAMAELRGAWAPLLHALCLALVAGRVAHAWGMSRTPEVFEYRVVGMATTLTVLLFAAILIVVT